MPRLLPELSPNGKSIVAVVVIIAFLVYGAVQLTCNTLAPEKPTVESQR